MLAGNRVVWERASEKHVREYDELLDEARRDGLLFSRELELLGPVLAEEPAVVHLQSGHGLDDIGLLKAGARSVVGIDYSSVAAGRRTGGLGSWGWLVGTSWPRCPAYRCGMDVRISSTPARVR